MNEGVHIFDRGIIDSLPELLTGTAQSLIEVDTAVTSWMDEVRQRLEQQCRILREKEKEAQEREFMLHKQIYKVVKILKNMMKRRTNTALVVTFNVLP